MIDLKNLIQEFQQLSLEDKKTKLDQMLVSLQNADDIFPKLLNTLRTNIKIDDNFCIEVYRWIITFGSHVEEKHKKRELDKLRQLHETIEKLHEQEAAERAQENSDAILEQI